MLTSLIWTREIAKWLVFQSTFVWVLFVLGVPIPRETGHYYDNQFTLCSGCVLVSTLMKSSGQTYSQVVASWKLGSTCDFVWPGLACTCVDLWSLWSRSNLHTSQYKFFTVWPPNASLFASSTCCYLQLLVNPFDQGLRLFFKPERVATESEDQGELEETNDEGGEISKTVSQPAEVAELPVEPTASTSATVRKFRPAWKNA